MTGPVKGVAGGGVSPDKLRSCQTGGVNLSAVAAVPVQNIIVFYIFISQ